MRNAKGQFIKGSKDHNMNGLSLGRGHNRIEELASTEKVKICKICLKEFVKPVKHSMKMWISRQTCGRKCAGILHSRNYSPSKETREKLRLANLGKVTMSGESHYNWKGGITPLRKKAYFSQEYKNWRTSVFERDKYTCQECGQKGHTLNADHIKPWAFYPELRYELSNGRTLCIPCHKKTDTWGNRKIT